MQIEPEILAWRCFQAVSIPDPHQSVRRLAAPTASQLAQITERYNRQRGQLTPVPPLLSEAAMMASLQRSARAARSLLARAGCSLPTVRCTALPGRPC